MRPMPDTEEGSEKAFPESLTPALSQREREKKEADSFETGLRTHLPPEPLARLKRACIGIAGAGGLGSNVA
ncbi:hypothetical protein, partial [Desulfobotulus sp.]|uniref:hypothetical protein n=1 Tax=Desulfobotulus sp. TaxID=1940337 RepID=UPI002A371B00